MNQPPNKKEEEEIVLASIMVGKDGIYKINLKPEDFYFLKNQKIFRAMCSLRDKRKPIDLVSLGSELGDELKEVGGHSHIAYLSSRVLGDNVPLTANIKHHAKEVKALAYRRELMDKSYRLIAEAEKGGDIEKCKRDLVDTGITEFAPQTIKELADSFSTEYTKPVEKGIMTGIKKLDEITSGIRAGELFTITAPPGLGKTNCALSFASHALKNDKKVLFVNLEMESNDVLSRLISIHTELDAWKIRNKCEDMEKVMNGLGELYETNFKLLTAWRITVEEITQHAFIEHKKNGLDLLVVDYLNKIKGDKNEKVRIDNAIQSLKACAMELKIPVIVPYQVDKVARREDRAPSLEDARGSTTVGDDAGLAIALTNESKKEDGYRWMENPEDKMRMYILKNRHGASGGFIDILFNKHTLKFYECG